jgi:hypothetical protein
MSYSNTIRKQRLELLVDNRTVDEILEAIIELAGREYDQNNKLLWPLCVKKTVESDHFRVKDRLIWSAFCYNNGVPFGLMVNYVVKGRKLGDDNAIDDILNSWNPEKKVKMAKMSNLMTYDHFCLSRQ